MKSQNIEIQDKFCTKFAKLNNNRNSLIKDWIKSEINQEKLKEIVETLEDVEEKLKNSETAMFSESNQLQNLNENKKNLLTYDIQLKFDAICKLKWICTFKINKTFL